MSSLRALLWCLRRSIVWACTSFLRCKSPLPISQANDELVASLKKQIVEKDHQLGLVLEQLRALQPWASTGA